MKHEPYFGTIHMLLFPIMRPEHARNKWKIIVTRCFKIVLDFLMNSLTWYEITLSLKSVERQMESIGLL